MTDKGDNHVYTNEGAKFDLGEDKQASRDK